MAAQESGPPLEASAAASTLAPSQAFPGFVEGVEGSSRHHEEYESDVSAEFALSDDDEELDEGGRGKGSLGRRKIDIRYIKDRARRHITFSKRKFGIMKKAYELSTLTGTQVLLLVVSETGLVYTFTTPKLQSIVTTPEGKGLIQACLNTPDGTEPRLNMFKPNQNRANEAASPVPRPSDGVVQHDASAPRFGHPVHLMPQYPHQRVALAPGQEYQIVPVHPGMALAPPSMVFAPTAGMSPVAFSPLPIHDSPRPPGPHIFGPPGQQMYPASVMTTAGLPIQVSSSGVRLPGYGANQAMSASSNGQRATEAIHAHRPSQSGEGQKAPTETAPSPIPHDAVRKFKKKPRGRHVALNSATNSPVSQVDDQVEQRAASLMPSEEPQPIHSSTRHATSASRLTDHTEGAAIFAPPVPGKRQKPN